MLNMSAEEHRLKEASNCIQKAKNHLKTSFWKLKTTPEYDLAAYEYARAAICYRNADHLDLCRDMYLEEAKCYTATKNLFHTAKAKENAAMACRDSKDYKRAKELYSESVDNYFASGSVTTAAQTLEKAAKMLELLMPESAAELYEKGLVFVSQDDTAKTANTFYNRLISIYLKLNKFEDARRISHDSIEKFCELRDFNKVGNIVLGLALIELKIGDSVAALKCLNLMPVSTVSLFSQEIRALETLVCAYENGDDEAFQNCLKNSVWKSLNNEYLRLIKTLKAPVEEYCGSSGNNANVSTIINSDDKEDVT